MVLIDTNVIIESFKGREESLELLELNFIRKRLEKIEIFDLDKKISRKSAELVFEFSKSHTLDIPDGIIAATCLVYDIPLLTYNTKDFRFIPGLMLYEK